MTSEPENAIQALTLAIREGHGPADDYPGLTHMRTEFVDHRRWVVVYLDAYLHPATSTYAGVLYTTPATEEQEGSESPPEVVPIERDPQPHYRIKRTPR